MGLFNSALHPRDGRGRFANKATIGFRVSTRSVSGTVGTRFPLVPGKVNIYVGALVRVENASRSKGPLDRLIGGAKERTVSAFPEGKLRDIASGLASKGAVNHGSTLITGSTGRRSTPTLRSQTSVGGSRRDTISSPAASKARRERAPRKPRQPRRVITP